MLPSQPGSPKMAIDSSTSILLINSIVLTNPKIYSTFRCVNEITRR